MTAMRATDDGHDEQDELALLHGFSLKPTPCRT